MDITTQEDDASLDGIAIIIDGELIISVDDAMTAFDTYKTSLPVDIIITQAKSGESFSKDDISNFNLGLQDFSVWNQNFLMESIMDKQSRL